MTTASDDGPAYRVSQSAAVKQTIRDIARRAATVGLLAEFVAALRDMMAELETDPLTFGDPLYHGKLPGSTVCHAMRRLLQVEYVVFEPERRVFILLVQSVNPLLS